MRLVSALHKFCYLPLQGGVSFVDRFLLFVLVFAVSVYCTIVVTCWEMVDLLALLYVMFLFFITFPYSVLGVVFDCIDS